MRLVFIRHCNSVNRIPVNTYFSFFCNSKGNALRLLVSGRGKRFFKCVRACFKLNGSSCFSGCPGLNLSPISLKDLELSAFYLVSCNIFFANPYFNRAYRKKFILHDDLIYRLSSLLKNKLSVFQYNREINRFSRCIAGGSSRLCKCVGTRLKFNLLGLSFFRCPGDRSNLDIFLCIFCPVDCLYQVSGSGNLELCACNLGLPSNLGLTDLKFCVIQINNIDCCSKFYSSGLCRREGLSSGCNGSVLCDSK